MEQYLIDQYKVFEDPYWLIKESDIVDYFKDGHDMFDCGQGYYEDEIDIIVKVGDKFYDVNIQADINSAKQDYGDRLYWVERISSVTYKEIEKPSPLPVEYCVYGLNLTCKQKRMLEDFLIEHKINW